VVFAPHMDRRYTMDELLELYSRLDFAIYFFWVLVTVIFLYLWIRQIEALEAKGVHRPEYRRRRKLHQFLYPCISGVIGAQSVLFAKCTVELLANSLTGSGFMFFLLEDVLCCGGNVFLCLLSNSLAERWTQAI